MHPRPVWSLIAVADELEITNRPDDQLAGRQKPFHACLGIRLPFYSPQQSGKLMILYAICLALGLIFTIFSAFAGHLFGGHDGQMDVGTGGHAEAGYDHSGVPGISFFSPTVLASFVTAFGACGLILRSIEATSSYWISAPLAALAGAFIALIVFWLFNMMFKHTESSSESR